MLSPSQILKSRTVWTLVAMGLMNGLKSEIPYIHDPNVLNICNGILGLLALIFRIAPNQHVQGS